MAMPAPPSGGPTDSCPQATAPSLQRRIPSFKLMDDEYSRSKRLRNRVPGAVRDDNAVDGAAVMPMLDDVVTAADRGGFSRLSSFTLGSDAVRGMDHASSWGSAAGGNCFGFGPESIDGEGEDAQPLDDATFADLHFFAMEEIGPSALSLMQEESSAALSGLDNDSHAAGHFHEGTSGSPFLAGNRDPKVTVPRDETTTTTSISRMDSGGDILETGGVTRNDSAREMLGGGVFDPDGRLPAFSVSMEEYLNQQLEAAEQSLHGRSHEELALDRATGSGGGGSSGAQAGTGDCTGGAIQDAGAFSARMHAARGASVLSLAFDPTPSVVLNSDQDIHMCSESAPRNSDVASRGQVGEGERSCGAGASQHHDVEEEEDESSDSEYEPPQQHEIKMKKGRRGRGVAAPRVTKTSSIDRTRGGNLSSVVVPTGTLKRQTSEDVAARLPLGVLECFYHVPLNVAAQELNVSLTMLKKLCRAYGVKRWPHRQVSSLDKTIARLDDKIKVRKASGKDAPSLVRKLTQAKKRRSVIIKTASAGLEADVLNTIFTCRPGDIDEDLLLKTTDVAKVLGNIKPSRRVGTKDSESDEEEEDEEGDDGRSHASSKSSFGSRRKPSIRAMPSSPPSLKPPPFTAKLSFSSHPPAFEPGGRTKSVSTKVEAKPGLKYGVLAAVKMELPTTHRTGKRGIAATTKVRKGVTVTSSAGGELFAPRNMPTAEKLAATSSPDPLKFDGSTSGIVASMANEPLSGCTSPAFSFGSSQASRAPMTGFSGVFGLSVPPSAAAGGCDSGSTTAVPRRTSGGSSTIESAVYARSTEAANAQGGARVTGWLGSGEKRAPSFGEWRAGAASTPQTSLSQLHLSDGAPDSPTLASTVDNFSEKLHLEPSPRGQLLSSPSSPLPPPLGHHPYLLQQQLPLRHQPHPGFHPLNWVPGRYPLAQQPYSFPVEAMSPIDTARYVPGQGSRVFHAFSKMDDSSDVDADANADDAATPVSTGGGVCSGGGGAEAAGGAAADAAAEGTSAAPGCEDATAEEKPADASTAGAAPRRTGFMSFLLHQAPNSPPYASSAPAAGM